MYSDSDDRRIKPRLMDGCRVSDHMVKLKRVSGLRRVIINEQKNKMQYDSCEAPWQ